MARRLAPLALMLSAPAAAATAPERFQETYGVSFGGFRVAEIVISGRNAPEGYAAEARVRADGVVNWFIDVSIDAEARGAGAWTAPAPLRLSADSAWRGKARRVEMAFDGARPTGLSVEPPFDERDWDLAPEEAGLAVDPLSGALTVLGPRPASEACATATAIYDGRRRFDVALDPPQADGDALTCAGRFTRVGGYKPRLIRERPIYDFTTRWAVEGGVATLEQLMVEVDSGWVVINRL